jgi:hypothetical protein
MAVAVVVDVTPLQEQTVARAEEGIVVETGVQQPRAPVQATQAERLQHMETLVQTQEALVGAQALEEEEGVLRAQDLEQPAEREFLFQLQALPKFMVLEVEVMQAQGVVEEQMQETGPVEQVLQAMGAASMLLTILVVVAADPPVETARPARGVRVS